MMPQHHNRAMRGRHKGFPWGSEELMGNSEHAYPSGLQFDDDDSEHGTHIGRPTGLTPEIPGLRLRSLAAHV